MSKEEHFENNWKGFLEMNPQLNNHGWLKDQFRMFYEFGYSKGLME